MTRAPKISVVIPAYNHAAYLSEAIKSVDTQNIPNLELRILDDGSTDNSFDVAGAALENSSGLTGRVSRQRNRGSSATLNRLISDVDSDYVAILNSDDIYAPGRLARFLDRAERKNLYFGFSAINYLQSGQVDDFKLFKEWYESKIFFSKGLPTCGFSLIASNLTVTSSNFFFSRELFDLTGGFALDLALTQDWEFAIKALKWTEPDFVPEQLLTYRVHGQNTYRKLHEVRISQSIAALDSYVHWAGEKVPNGLAPTPSNWPGFFPVYSRTCSPAFSDAPIGKFLPQHMLDQEMQPGKIEQRDKLAIRNLVDVCRETQDLASANFIESMQAAAGVWADFAEKSV